MSVHEEAEAYEKWLYVTGLEEDHLKQKAYIGWKWGILTIRRSIILSELGEHIMPLEKSDVPTGGGLSLLGKLKWRLKGIFRSF